MKAERRHELKTNTLALAMQRLPELWKKYGARILLALLIVGVVVVLLINRVGATRQQARAETQSLAIARTLVDDLRFIDFQSPSPLPQDIAATRRQTIDEAERFITPLVGSRNARARAEGLVALADVRWVQANLPQLPGADIDPALQTDPQRSREQLLDEAEQLYRQVLEQHADQTLAAVSARFGLAAVAENRRQWDEARQHYEAVADDEHVTLAFREQARIRLAMLEQIRQPVLMGQPAPEFDMPGAMPVEPIMPGLGDLSDPTGTGGFQIGPPLPQQAPAPDQDPTPLPPQQDPSPAPPQ